MWDKIKSFLGLGPDPEVVRAKARMAEDSRDPRKAFIQGILAMSYEADPGYLPGHAETAIREWYGVQSRQELIESIQGFIQSSRSTPGYNVFRSVFLARAGYGAGFLSEDESWRWAFFAGQRAQQIYGQWEEYGQGYLE